MDQYIIWSHLDRATFPSVYKEMEIDMYND